MKSDDRFTIPFRFLASSLCLWLVCGCHPQVVYLFPALEHDSGFFINHLDTEEKAFAMKKITSRVLSTAVFSGPFKGAPIPNATDVNTPATPFFRRQNVKTGHSEARAKST